MQRNHTSLGTLPAAHSHTGQGMALIVVLWLLAALSLLAASLGSTVRDQASQAQVQRTLVQGRAVGEAAIYQVLQVLQQHNQRPTAETQAITFAGHTVAVRFQAWGGMVNINTAPAGVWKALLQGAEGLSSQQAQTLAQAIVDTRESLKAEQKSFFPQPWDKVEDLLQVPGLGYGIYTVLQPYLVASAESAATVRQNTAPSELAGWLQAHAPEQLQASTDNGRLFTAEAEVIFPDGVVRVQRPLAWQADQATGLPWTVLASTVRWTPQ